ncbi:DUF6183 family protein [Kitasatospora sp. NPDC001309]|uniref:DUF6183 family protein n=1 Tax=Kitasatospora sp. NPDC001309 TaxID=3364013 RepID=UPI0036841EB6
MAKTIEQLVAGLAGTYEVSEVCLLLEAHLERGDTAFHVEVGAALHRRYGSGWAGAEYASLYDHVLWDVISTPGRVHVEHAFALKPAVSLRPGRPLHRTAAVLAEYQPLEALAWVFGAPAGHPRVPEELRACLVQELVLRGAPVAELPAARAWAAASPYWAAHPLARLPWTLDPIEGEPLMAHYSRGAVAFGVPYALPEGDRIAAAGRVAVEIGADEPGLTVALRRWARQFNGQLEAAVFEAERPVAPAELPGTLAGLPLDCMSGEGCRGPLGGVDGVDEAHGGAHAAHLAVVPTTAAAVWRQLFVAASSGAGDERVWSYGGYGRLEAWRSLAALVGAGPEERVAEVARRAGECAWYAFTMCGDWFIRDDLDLGFAVLDAGRRRLAVIAATDYRGG